MGLHVDMTAHLSSYQYRVLVSCCSIDYFFALCVKDV